MMIPAPTDLRSRAEHYFKLGVFELALDYLELALAAEPPSLELRLLQARTLEQLGRDEEAEGLLDRLLSEAPESSLAYALRGQLRARRATEALEQTEMELTMALEESAAVDATALASQAEAQQDSKETQRALADLRRAAELAPQDLALRLQVPALLAALERQEEATVELEAIATLFPGSPEPYLQLARLSGDPLPYLEKALSAAPSHPEALRARAAARREDGELQDALEDLSAYLDQAPDDRRALEERAQLLAELGDQPATLADYQLLAARHPSYRLGYAQRIADLLWAAGDAAQAQAAYLQLKRYKYADVCVELARPLLEREFWQPAQELLKEGARHDPSYPVIPINLCTLYQRQERFPAALRQANKAIRLDASNPSAYFNRASVYERTGRPRQALADLTRAWELGHPRALFNRGVLHLAQDQLEAAVADFSAALATDPRPDRVLNNRAWCFYLLGEYPQARRDVQRCLELDQENPKAYATAASIAGAEGREEDFFAAIEQALALGLEVWEEDPAGYQPYIDTPRMAQLLARYRGG